MSDVLDLSGFKTKDNANSGVWTEIILAGKRAGLELKIRGADSDEVIKYNREISKKATERLYGAIAKKRNDDDDEEEDDDLGVIIRIGGIRGFRIEGKGKNESKIPVPSVILDGQELKDDEKSYRFLLDKIPEVKGHVLAFSNDRTNFLSLRKEN
jgi:hypothetical protein